MNSEPGLERLRDSEGGRYLQAHLGEDGSLHIDGHAPVSAEVIGPPAGYEWCEEIDAVHVGRLIELLGRKPGDEGR